MLDFTGPVRPPEKLTPPVELRPCVGCDKPAELLKLNAIPDAYSVWCSDSHCTYKDKPCDTPEEACAAWNNLADEVSKGNSKFFSQTPPVKLHPCDVCGRQPVLFSENDDTCFRYRCQCTEELSVETGYFSTVELAAADWNDINEPSGSPLLHTKWSWHPLAFLLNPCPFCGEKPELRKCPNDPDGKAGWFIRCLCDSGNTVVETVWQPNVRAAVDAWNTRVSKHPSFFLNRYMPFVLFAGGAFLFAAGVGLHEGPSAFFLTLGAALAVSATFHPQSISHIEERVKAGRSNLVLRPDLPSCSSCGEVPALHKTFSGRFRVQCSDSRCWHRIRNRFVHLTERDAAAAWIEAQK
jgi:hypothetical protein